MVGQEKLRELAERQNLLVAQAELRRVMFDLEARRVRSSFGWLARAGQAIHTCRPWLGALAPVAGLLVAWRGPRVLRWALSTAPLWKPVAEVVRGLRATRR